MMKFSRIILAAMMAVMALGARAQGVFTVSYDSIETIVKERPEEYRALTSRFAAADTTLTMPELAVVYYGRAFAPGFNPTESYDYVMEAYDAGDLTKALTLVDEALRRNPVSLPMLFKAYGLCRASELPLIKERAADVQKQILMLCDLIEASGEGVAMYSPFCVLTEADMDEFLTKYCRIQRELSRSDIGDEKAVKVHLDGIDDDIILYFDLLLARKAQSN